MRIKLHYTKTKEKLPDAVELTTGLREQFSQEQVSFVISHANNGAFLPIATTQGHLRSHAVYATQGCVPLKEFLKMRLTKLQYANLLTSFAEAQDVCRDRGYACDQIVYNPEFVFVNIDQARLQFCFVPIDGYRSSKTPRDLLEVLATGNINFVVQTDEKYVRSLARFIQENEAFSLSAFHTFLEKTFTSTTMQQTSFSQYAADNDVLARSYVVRRLSDNHGLPLTKAHMTIGRSSQADLHFGGGSTKMSRVHALLEICDDGVRISDLSSSNGTFVDDIRLETDQSKMIYPQMHFRLADEEFILTDATNVLHANGI